MGDDFNVFYNSGLDLWRGVYSGLYPLPMNGLFALLALFPRPVAFALLTFIGLALFVAVFKRWSFAWIWFHPALAVLRLGQVDLLFMWLLWWASPVALALMTLKPQLFPLALPALLSDRSKWRPFALACLALYGPVTIIRPMWPIELLRRVNDGRLEMDTYSTTIWSSLIVGFIVLLSASILFRIDWRSIFWTCNPTIRWYDFSMLAGGSLWLIPASWLLWWVAKDVGNPSPVAFLGLINLALRRKSPLPRPHSI